ncbi:DNA primase [Candidatus Woesearchaeota archaeon]|nr:DNA primase [Candidatus Woesearchaeota archaeon]
MGKIAPVSAKYIVHSSINIEGVVERPDVIGAIFGQTEGLLGSDLELRELQRSGRIGRIEVNVNTTGGKTTGEITIPSSLDKAETCIVAAALEVIQRIGPCNAKVDVLKIEDVRISKRSFVIERAKVLLRNLTDTILPDSQELADEVAQSVRVMEVTEWGKDRLPAGPSVDESDEVILVEGRADVLNLLKHGFKNCVALNGTSIPETITQLAAQKVITAFVDGDRGGDLIIRELMNVAEIDFVCKAPDGKEVEEITQKEIHKALRGRIAAEQVKLDIQRAVQNQNGKEQERRRQYQQPPPRKQFPPRPMRPMPVVVQQQSSQKKTLATDEKERLKSALDDLFGTRGAYLLDKTLNVLGKVPVTELKATIKSVNDVHAIVLDGTADQELLKSAEDAHVNYIVTVDSQVKNNESKVIVLTDAELTA